MQYPIEYRWLLAHKFAFLTPWYELDEKQVISFRNEYQKETNKDILPFATRQDNDDIAGFEVIDGEATRTVLTVHLPWSKKLEGDGYPSTVAIDNIFDWIAQVMFGDTQEWIDEDEIRDLLEEDEE